MKQIFPKAVLKEYVKQFHNTVHSDMKQLHFKNTFKPMHWKELDGTQSKSILKSYMFLKQNRYGKIKGQTVTGRNKQRDYI